MWFHESERIGKQKCTPTGYTLHVISELIGFIGLLLLLALPPVLVWRGIDGTFRARDLWLLAGPFGVGIISEGLFRFLWWLAWRKGFQFDYERSESSWIEVGERRTYKYP
jgi:hypothetical protein